MCGINGFISYKNYSEEAHIASLKSMNQLIVHRGPDDDGFHTYKQDNAFIAMAMRRLSIIDLHTGKQPIYNDDKSICIVFNGEIYNYQKIKKTLENQGVSFKTTSDTEVILKLYESKGTSGFKELDGMYAFSIHDKNLNKVFIARDFFGEKPLYYFHNEDTFVWASELKSIINFLDRKPEISNEGLNLFFKLTYIPAPHTIYKNIYKLEANRYIEFSVEENKFKIHKTSDLSNFKNEKTSLQKATDQVRNMVMESIESRSISDVPLGTFLSGGVDSSIVSLGLSQIKSSKIDTFSIGFDKASFDETDKSRTVAKLINSNHHEFILTEKDIEASLDEIILNFDEPFADSSALPTYLVSKKTRDHVKVALTGDGGDEVFGGYNKYYIGKLNARYTNYIPKPFHSGIKSLSNFALSTKDDKRGFRFKLKKLLNAIDYDNHFYWNIISLGFIETDNLLNDSFYIENPFSDYQQILNGKAPKTIHDFREIDRHISLEGDMLVKVDRTSMLKSLECRAPFLNKSLWEYTNSLPEEFLMDKWDKKFILKEAFKNEFPEGFLDKSKQGFSVPVGDWLRAHLKPELIKYTSDELLKSQGIFQTNPIKALINNHLSGKEDSSYKVWSYFVFQKWFENTYS